MVFGLTGALEMKVRAIVNGDTDETALDQLAVVMVCCAGRCASRGIPTLAALRPLVARTSRAILMRTGCVQPHRRCPTPPTSCGVRLQLCGADLRPLEPSMAVAGTLGGIYRQVQAWLDEDVGTEGEGEGGFAS